LAPVSGSSESRTETRARGRETDREVAAYEPQSPGDENGLAGVTDSISFSVGMDRGDQWGAAQV
jgi:hypothetical protein